MSYSLALSLAFLAAHDHERRLLREPLPLFPDAECITHALAWNREYVAACHEAINFYSRPDQTAWFLACIREAESLWWMWDCLRCQWSEFWLRELYRGLGPENYAVGRMPPPVPLHRFRVIE